MTRNGLTRTLGVAVLMFGGCHINGNLSTVTQKADFRQTADLAGVTSIVVETRNGSVDVRCDAATREADISGTKYAGGLTEEAARENLDRITIRAERDAARPEVLRIVAEFPVAANLNAGVSFKISLPADKELRVHTSNGQIVIAGAGRGANLETSNGSIRVTTVGGEVRASTSNGSVTMEDINGNVVARTSNGRIELQRVGVDKVEATTSNGSIRAIDTRGVLQLDTSNGRIDLRTGSLPGKPQVHLYTTNGSVSAELPASADAMLQLRTSNGHIQTNLGSARTSEVQATKQSVTGKLNAGGGLIDVHNSNGSVTFTLVDAPVGRP